MWVRINSIHLVALVERSNCFSRSSYLPPFCPC